MSLLAPWFLAGLLVLAPLLTLHLRRRRRRQEVASLLLWRELASAAPGRRRTALVPSLLLLLQVLIVVLLVLALARPARDGAEAGAGLAPQVYVLDDSRTMRATDVAPDRLTAVRRDLERRLARLPAATPVTVVAAGAVPRLLVAGASPDAASDALADLRATAPNADLRAGLTLAGGQLHRAGGTVTLVHAIENSAPRVERDGVAYAAVTVGTRADDQVLEQPIARCAPVATPAPAAGATRPAGPPSAGSPAAPPTCTVFAAVRNDGDASLGERLVVERDGTATASRALTLAPGERVEVAFPAPAGARLTIRLDSSTGTAADSATVTVPAPASPTAVTLVSDRPADAPLARALAATPGVTLRLIPPQDYTAADASTPDLLVLDRWLPDGELPAARSLLLVAPPRLPGGRVGAALADPTLSGTAAATLLLAGVDLDALAIDAGAARRTTLPTALRALAWAPGGPLLAAGTIPGERPERIALLTFDPQASTLPQLPAFPILLANVVAWASGGAADLAAAGAGDATSAAATDASAADPVILRASDGGGTLPGPPREWWPWLVAAGLLLLLAEWSYPRWPRRRESAA
ncbi:VWA domain-containing protein [Conexibacter stalactiti]|uniref:VWA domain-containing protein n=1 Tax=Conexibacter stalactiti TaxID=1940611 RepID=A0ABU4I031_9ACTN|nr:VWA domain-containing protein [Conexibacter stalactiti]MDW5598871.1 VWA domain-containing protein [Conexibacter stalactiti]MEC5039513.1 VWA domain-containing protein [Conexibacter stalactiti]